MVYNFNYSEKHERYDYKVDNRIDKRAPVNINRLRKVHNAVFVHYSF